VIKPFLIQIIRISKKKNDHDEAYETNSDVEKEDGDEDEKYHKIINAYYKEPLLYHHFVSSHQPIILEGFHMV